MFRCEEKITPTFGLASLLLVVVAFAPAAVWAGKRSLASPQDAFNAAAVAMKKDDLAGLCECITDDSRDLLAGGLVANVLIVKKRISAAGPSPDQRRLLKTLDAVLAKHGHSDRSLLPLESLALTFPAGDPSTRLKIAQAMLHIVKDRNLLAAELIAVIQKKGTAVGGIEGGNATLAELKIEKDVARALIVRKQDGNETRRPILFQRVRESWKIDLSAELNQAFSGKKK